MLLVPVLRSNSIKSWPTHPDGGAAVYLTLERALRATFDYDAHFAAYSVATKPRRLSSAALLPEHLPELGGVIPMWLLPIDVDCPEKSQGAAAVDAWWQLERPKVSLVRAAYPGLFIYRTRGGYRIVGRLPEPWKLASGEDAQRWRAFYLAWRELLARRFSIDADRACGDWTRLYRLPRATRDEGGTPESRETLGDARQIGVWGLPSDLEESDVEAGRVLAGPVRPSFVPMPALGGGWALRELFRMRGWLGPEQRDGKVNVFCPWRDEHGSGKDLDSSTVIYPPSGGDLGSFKCLHQHCDGRTALDVLKLFTADEIDEANGRPTRAQREANRVPWPTERDRAPPSPIEREPGDDSDDDGYLDALVNGHAEPANGHKNGVAPSRDLHQLHEPWPEPKPLPPDRPPVPAMDPELLPHAFRPWLEDIAHRTQTPLEYGAVTAMVALAAVVGRKLGIRPKRRDNWHVVVNLWGAVVGPPGVLKSPVQKQAIAPITRLEAEKLHAWSERQQKRESTYETTRREAERKRIKKAIDAGVVETKEIERLAELDQEEKPEPAPRMVVNDITVEKLGMLLGENPNGLLQFRDEMMGWIRSLEKEGFETARQNYLECWNGDGEFVYDRVGRGTTHIRGACVSVMGSIQPGPLAGLLQHAAENQMEADGFTARFQLMVYPDLPEVMPEIDERPNTAAKNLAFEVFKAIDQLVPEDRGALYEQDQPAWLHFDDEAQPVVLDWLTMNKRRARSADLPEVLRAHLSKYASLMPSLALLCHLADTVTSLVPLRPVSLEATQRAIAWCSFLEAHARRVYAPVLESEAATAKLVVEKLRSGALTPPFTARDVYRPHWSGLTVPDRVAGALGLLESLGWLRSTEQKPQGPRGGRPSPVYYANPAIVVATVSTVPLQVSQ